MRIMENYKITLQVIGGADKGKTFEFKDSDNFLLGRDAEGSYAHYRLSSKDMYVSRNHCIFEIKPPRCFLIDNNSLNGTKVRKWNELNFERISRPTEIYDGDEIQIGDTILKVNAILYNDEETQEASNNNGFFSKRIDEKNKKKVTMDQKMNIVYCICCGKEVNHPLKKKDPSNSYSIRYGCEDCNRKRHGQMEKQDRLSDSRKDHIDNEQYTKRERLVCFSCGCDMSGTANNDSRAAELYNVALYLCEKCMNQSVRLTKNTVINDYKLLEKIGKGAMGIAYKAWHKPTGRLVVLKTMLTEHQETEKYVKYFEREMTLSSNFIHDNVIRILDLDPGDIKINQPPYYVSEYASGGDLQNLLINKYQGLMSINEVCKIIIQILSGLEILHNGNKRVKGIVHRDIKPQNILLTFDSNNNRVAKLADLGLAKCWEDAGLSRLTQTGEYFGSPIYMSQLQILDYKYVKPSTDVYAVGVILYLLLSGQYPFDYPSPMELMQLKKRRDDNELMWYLKKRYPKPAILMTIEDNRIPIRKRNPSIPKDLAEIVDSTIKKEEKKRRYTEARQLREALIRFTTGDKQ
jgi:serine/threonine-protein kinase